MSAVWGKVRGLGLGNTENTVVILLKTIKSVVDF